MNKPIVRGLRQEDPAALERLERECFDLPWSRAAFEAELINPCAHYVVLENDTGIIGYAGMWIVIDEAHVTNVAVSPSHRRRGYGRLLMCELMRRAVEAGAEMMTLEVRQSNHVAQSLYRDLGFTWCGLRKRYYSDNGEDAVIMWNRRISAALQGGCEAR
ncbi:MAG: ribosomal protein S18-alanine N-acetyltransferase [Clostridiales bacterium]|jgi:ribosomal-protein-alanine N-acetyltransferase|nr:ribosomal protein S18-alanine N-acetyltransferase [Clostridiales bacterium]